MKENRYDDEEFFERYGDLDRSKKGLQAAGEWHTLQTILPDFAGKRVLDLGCGYGWHCRYAADHGASLVLGTDISEKMLQKAREMTPPGCISYRRMAMEDMHFPPCAFDVVLSSLALHYAASFTDVCGKVYACLAPGGQFVFSVEHPVFTAEGRQAWHRDAEGDILHWPVDRYFEEGQREAVFLGKRITKYHRTLTTYVGGLISCGFTLRALHEPEPDAVQLRSDPGMRDELRRPMMLLIAAVKL